MRLAAHRPNFCPWFPFFHKIGCCDVFVVETHLQCVKQNFQNRFNIGNDWFAMPVAKAPTDTLLKDMRYVEPEKHLAKLRRRLGARFPGLFRAAQFGEVIWDCVEQECSPSLAETNDALLRAMWFLLWRQGRGTTIVFDEPPASFGTDMLIDMCRRHGAREYLTGIGAVKPGTGYLDVKKMNGAGIKVLVQRVPVEWRRHTFELVSERGEGFVAGLVCNEDWVEEIKT